MTILNQQFAKRTNRRSLVCIEKLTHRATLHSKSKFSQVTTESFVVVKLRHTSAAPRHLRATTNGVQSAFVQYDRKTLVAFHIERAYITLATEKEETTYDVLAIIMKRCCWSRDLNRCNRNVPENTKVGTTTS